MPDIALRFHKDMLVLSSPVAVVLARQGFDVEHDLEFANLVEPEAVRDALRGCAAGDWDITTDAEPEQVEQVFSGERLIETGLRHGTVTVLLDGLPLEITTYRVDGGYSDHRRPDSVTFTRSLREDLLRRDFTMNALAYSPRTGLVDICGGAEDLARGVVRG